MSGRDDVSGGRDKKRGNDEGTVMMMGYRNGSRVTEERGDVICVSLPELSSMSEVGGTHTLVRRNVDRYTMDS